MPKAATESKTKAATAKANSKPISDGTTENVVREPSIYNQYMKANLGPYKERNPGVPHKEAFTAVAVMWRDAPENPNRGKEPKPKKTKAEGDNTVKVKAKPKSDEKTKKTKPKADDKTKSVSGEKAKTKPKDEDKPKSKPKSKSKSKSKPKSAEFIDDDAENVNMSSDPVDPVEPSSDV
ncbi:uncharacterized protein SCHCODRAFT_02614371 [Schizophyllum commune H4-8]|uniref:YABBY protein C-terminal domain-containing protein n=1 Tax=Schizophyllum commune (strain H4-8 / FGSC 9210) TaxID=578458 RepID=D8PZ78_SCHCM|nr:uncharacterized protein SCHCODRAFT_02614371 [Schizophyllum commune H4-8]KAI5896256.1 hypothetical protein SCHCODRAFT_02614371 [Schizophyllum commune H4-8]